jgi:hypothetical protein
MVDRRHLGWETESGMELLQITPTNQHDNGGIYLLIWCAIGFPIAWYYMRQQRMVESTKRSGKAGVGVIFVLSVMWPLLLMSMFLIYLQPPPKSSRQKTEDPRKNEQT